MVPSGSRVGQGESFDGRRRQRQRDHTEEDSYPQWMCPVCMRKQFKWRTFCRRCLLFAPGVPPGPDGSLGFGPAWVGARPRRELGQAGGESAGPDGGESAGPDGTRPRRELRQAGGGSAGPDGSGAVSGSPVGVSDPVSEAWRQGGVDAMVEAWRRGSPDGGTSNVYADVVPTDAVSTGGARARPTQAPAEPEPEPLTRGR